MRTSFRALTAVIAIATVATLALPSVTSSHCQIPCGIYDDQARIDRMLEDTTTIEKAMAQITELSGKADPQSQNQLVRWITNKEEHASNIITIVAEYFLTQKLAQVAPGAEGRDAYLASLADHHAVMRAAMKAKQNVGQEHVDALRAAIEALGAHYQHEH
jgi:nickel superoxide dismutase